MAMTELKSWADWKPEHLVGDTLHSADTTNLRAYIEWAFQNVKPEDYKQAINRLYSWCYRAAEFLEGIDLVTFNTRFKKATEDYLKGKKLNVG